MDERGLDETKVKKQIISFLFQLSSNLRACVLCVYLFSPLKKKDFLVIVKSYYPNIIDNTTTGSSLRVFRCNNVYFSIITSSILLPRFPFYDLEIYFINCEREYFEKKYCCVVPPYFLYFCVIACVHDWLTFFHQLMNTENRKVQRNFQIWRSN